MYKGGKFFSNNDIYFVREKNLLNFYFYGNKMAIGKLEDRSKKYSDEDNEKSNVKNQIIVPVFEPPSPISIDRTSKKCAIFSCNKSKKESLKGNRVLKRKRKDRTDEAPPLKVRRKRNLQQGLVRESLSKEEKDEISKIRILKSSKDYMTVMSRNFNGNRRIEETLSLPYFSSVSNKENGNCSVSNSNQRSLPADMEPTGDSSFLTNIFSSFNKDQSKKSDRSNKSFRLIKSLEYKILTPDNQKL